MNVPAGVPVKDLVEAEVKEPLVPQPARPPPNASNAAAAKTHKAVSPNLLRLKHTATPASGRMKPKAGNKIRGNKDAVVGGNAVVVTVRVKFTALFPGVICVGLNEHVTPFGKGISALFSHERLRGPSVGSWEGLGKSRSLAAFIPKEIPDPHVELIIVLQQPI